MAIVAAGVDIGSTTSKVVVLADGVAVASRIGPSSTNPARGAAEIFQRALDDAGVSRDAVHQVVGTGYGRAQVAFADRNISEITCHGRGAHAIWPSARTVIDIGGQDTKVIAIDGDGALLDFAMNDKCAAGTGRFLEAMARSLDLPLEAMQDLYAGPQSPCQISSMCSVFAESEVINLVNEGVELSRIVKGLFLSLAQRVSALALRLGITPDLVMTGGVAKNRGVREAIRDRLGMPIPESPSNDPQLAGALGAALIAADFARKAAAERTDGGK